MTEHLQPPVLLTGSHRSGTTWVGAALALSGELANLHEPFNPGYHRSWLGFAPEHWYHCVTGADDHRYREAFERILRFRPPTRALVGRAESVRDHIAVIRELGNAGRWRLGNRRLLLKDPIAFFSAPWLADTFAADVIVLVRHPAAFVSSLIKLDWRFDFRNFAQQPALMEGPLAPYAEPIDAAAAEPPPMLDHAILLWRCLAATAAKYRSDRPEWRVVRYEDLAADPTEGFALLSAGLGLRFDADVEQRLASITTAPSTSRHDVSYADRLSVTRDSRTAMTTWRTRLSAETVDRVRVATEREAHQFYSAIDWDLPDAR